MKLLSLFNGMSCGLIAMLELGLDIDAYYSSEIDKFANKVANSIYPDTIQLGDITKWETWELNWSEIDIILAGSPCQGFSFAGKQLAFNDPRSALFFEFVKIYEHIKSKNPNVKFLLENVRMKAEHENVISQILGIQPIMINSALVSAQNRVRLYWTNIKTKKIGLFGHDVIDIEQPKDEGILLKDILESEVDEKYYLSESVVRNLMAWGDRNKNNGNGFYPNFVTEKNKSTALTTGSTKSSSTFLKVSKKGIPKPNQDKASCFTAGGNSGGNHSDMDLIVEPKSVIQINPSTESGGKQPYQQNRIYDSTGKNPALTAQLSTGSNLIVQRPRGYNNGGFFEDKAPTITKNSYEHNNHIVNGYRVRRLTPRECGRLQTVPEKYLDIMLNCGVSETQLYKMFGNGWTIKVIMHILKHLK